MSTLTQYLATTPMPITWILQASTPTCKVIFPFSPFPFESQQTSSTRAVRRFWGHIVHSLDGVETVENHVCSLCEL